MCILFSHCDLIFILMSVNDVKQLFVHVHEFLMADVTNYPTFRISNNTNLLSYVSGGQS